MEIFKKIQYNHSVGKYKVLSSNAGVGSVITTKAGFFIMPKSVSFWNFIKRANQTIEQNPNESADYVSNNAYVDLINDPRFVNFLKKSQSIPNLKHLIDIPHLSLNERNNPNVKSHPLYKKYEENTGGAFRADELSIPAFHFPRWFYSRKQNYFKPINEWEALWQQKTRQSLEYFAPPRDPYTKTSRIYKDKVNGMLMPIDTYETLIQIPMVLICKNGHISDIPWYQLFCAYVDGKRDALSHHDGFELFDYPCRDCAQGGKHELQWIENRNNSESWGTLKCSKCGETHSLEGIMNIRPFCKGETPWNGIGTTSGSPCTGVDGNSRGIMQMALVTSNSIYYADYFKSLYIPPQYLVDSVLDPIIIKVLDRLEQRLYPRAQAKNPNITKEEYINSIDLIERIDEILEVVITQEQADIITNKFLGNIEEPDDRYEQYRFDEYKIFSNYEKSLQQVPNLEFNDIELPEILKPYFKKIQQVDRLAITQTQLGFSRVSMPVPLRINGKVTRNEGQRIYKEPVERVFCMPANQSFGEGLFFEFNMNAVDEWVNRHHELFSKRYNQPSGDIGQAIKEEILQFGAPRFYLLHTFSHIIMKELEFSCGYPTASLQERIYYSDRMCGVLIYTADGAEGSMGGLVWQGQPCLIERIIKNAITRADECSSDPLCWENEEQLNLAACFSCCLVSETSCEKQNLGLDRRAIIDPKFGFFKDMQY